MQLKTSEILLDNGWLPSKGLGQAIKAYDLAVAQGMTQAEALVSLAVPTQEPKLEMRGAPLPLGVALTASTDEERVNKAAVLKCMENMTRVPVVSSGAIMPDACPAGSDECSITVGGVIAVKDAIIPAAHSADICCSMHVTLFDLVPQADINVSSLMDRLQKSTRFGAGGRKPENRVYHPVLEEAVWDNQFLKGLQEYAAKHMADQGDGNHFAYLGKLELTSQLLVGLKAAGVAINLGSLTEGGTVYALVTHHGSRGLGAQLYKRGQQAAIAYTNTIANNIPNTAAWLSTTTQQGQDYWLALQYIERWTKANHEVIHKDFISTLALTTQVKTVCEFGNAHNFVWYRNGYYYHGKGATPAWSIHDKPLLGVIPLNMAAPILIVLGNDSKEYLGFAPHGAGRNISRTATLRKYPTAEEKTEAIHATTAGLDVRWWYGKPDLSETPLGYKAPNTIKQEIHDYNLATVIGEIQPLGCIMAGESEQPWRKKTKK